MILSVNPGSSSLKYKLFRHDLTLVREGSFHIGDPKAKNHKEAVKGMLKQIPQKDIPEIKQIGIRIVHGGSKFLIPTQINNSVLSEVEKFNHLAPLHNPVSVEVVRILQALLTEVPIYGVFDTSFFALLPDTSSAYAIPYKIAAKESIKRYGFHGISHQYVAEKLDPGRKMKLISIHLGAGCSAAAIDKGRPKDTSMGFTPDEGLIMLTRSGDLDPGLVLYLVKKYGIERTKLMIEKESGICGLSGIKSSIYDVLSAIGEKVSDPAYRLQRDFSSEERLRAKSALRTYVHKIKKYVGAYAAIMGGVDIVAFTGKVGFYSRYIRNETTKGLKFLNIKMTEIVEPDEELAMAKEIVNMGL